MYNTCGEIFCMKHVKPGLRNYHFQVGLDGIGMNHDFFSLVKEEQNHRNVILNDPFKNKF